MGFFLLVNVAFFFKIFARQSEVFPFFIFEVAPLHVFGQIPFFAWLEDGMIEEGPIAAKAAGHANGLFCFWTKILF